MNTLLKKTLLAIAAILIIIQFIPVEKTNPPVTGEINAEPEIASILKRSCYDCHSNQTDWPWYAHIAPVSFLVAHDVAEGREHLNFSIWQNISSEKQRNLISELLEETEKGDMPLPIYTIMHTGTRLSEDEVKALQEWAAREFGITGETD